MLRTSCLRNTSPKVLNGMKTVERSPCASDGLSSSPFNVAGSSCQLLLPANLSASSPPPPHCARSVPVGVRELVPASFKPSALQCTVLGTRYRSNAAVPSPRFCRSLSHQLRFDARVARAHAIRATGRSAVVEAHGGRVLSSVASSRRPRATQLAGNAVGKSQFSTCSIAGSGHNSLGGPFPNSSKLFRLCPSGTFLAFGALGVATLGFTAV